ncbi:hypothetical protein BSL82_15835 [Tardibacter chloracetimidivorans]|uniref:DUF3310 domain-containing protein n=1 Tax=Tardibacter chloracetimidivorans TaxID=1921510 RepID=A0A1L3ZY61_9SPHN|nr:DUF3310 domain-containing protein [Tardibacter chloracetimidivorans]API60576.1 hypothetical protein BSL82_15835 [Tardibacter chloracetimidivorans]
MDNPLSRQVGGEHYTKLKIQPLEYSMANGLDACQHSIIKYVTRFRDKGGINDLEKALHVLEILIAREARPSGERWHTYNFEPPKPRDLNGGRA